MATASGSGTLRVPIDMLAERDLLNVYTALHSVRQRAVRNSEEWRVCRREMAQLLEAYRQAQARNAARMSDAELQHQRE
ncbi:hypothetical protein JCM10449v2_007488 [Rhodotorula kratochvilovae]